MLGMSINAKIFLAIVLFINIGFVVKMFNKYYKTKESGYLREKTLQEQIEQRVMKCFGNREELNKLIHDFVRYKEASEKILNSFQEQSNQLNMVNRKLEDSRKKFEDEKGQLQKEIWILEDSLSQMKNTIREKDWKIHELIENLETVKESLTKKQPDAQPEVPSRWYIPVQ